MRIKPVIVIGGLFVGGLVSVIASGVTHVHAQPRQAGYEYRVQVFSYNPGERGGEEARARAYERAINVLASEGWEPVGSILSRDGVQTVGGAVTTRDTTSFVAFRRARR